MRSFLKNIFKICLGLIKRFHSGQSSQSIKKSSQGKMLEDDTQSSQSTEDSIEQTKTTRKSNSTVTKGAKRKNQASTRKRTTDSSGLTKLNKSLFRTPSNPKGIIKAVKQVKSKTKSPGKGNIPLKSISSGKTTGKELSNKLKALKSQGQDLTVFTKTILRALYELNEKE